MPVHMFFLQNPDAQVRVVIMVRPAYLFHSVTLAHVCLDGQGSTALKVCYQFAKTVFEQNIAELNS